MNETETRPPETEKALMHLSAAAVEADFGMLVSSWGPGEIPDPAWWAYRDALDGIRKAEQAFERARRRRA